MSGCIRLLLSFVDRLIPNDVCIAVIRDDTPPNSLVVDPVHVADVKAVIEC